MSSNVLDKQFEATFVRKAIGKAAGDAVIVRLEERIDR
jgi:hypothetical protein